MIEAGKVLQGRYRVDRQIGQGGMGAVFIATDERFGSTVAIKETFFTDDKFRKAFEREARLLNSLRHPALPRVSDHFIDGNGQFIVMEFIDGDDLSEQLESEGKVFAVDDVLGWAGQLLDALEYLHSQEMPVIHRDIKPQNLKLTSRGQIILLDFGLAKGNTTNAESATAAKSVFGYSRNYASIEQIQGSGTDPRSDLYSLAATLYHLLTGVPPADALTRAMNVLSDKPDPLIEAHQIRAEIPYGISRVLYEAMALSAEQRPESAKEMRAMLADAKDEEAPADAQTILDNSPRTNIYSQKTKVYGASSRVSNFKQSDIKTETLQTDESKVTQLKPRRVTGDFAENETKVQPLVGVTTSEQKSRRGLVMGAALGSLLLLAIGAFATYIFKPEVFNMHQPEASAEPDKKMIIVQVPTENANVADANTETANVNTVTVVPVQPANVVVPAETKPKDAVAKTETKPAETKPKTETLAPKNNPASVDDPPDIEVDADDVDDSSSSGEPPTNPRTKQKFPIQVWRKMSPAERRKLREALDMNRQMEMDKRRLEIQKRNLPKPPQTPNQ